MEYTREYAEAQPLFDSAGFDKLIAVAGVDAVVNLAEVFETQGRERLERIREAVGSGDLSVIEGETHALGSSAGTFGAQRMHILSRAAEAAAVDGDADLAISLSRNILDIADESFNLAATYVDTLSDNETQ